MKPPPQGWPRISSALYYEDPKKAIEWLGRAFGFEVQLLVEGDNGSVMHSELVFGGGMIMVSGTSGERAERSPFAKSPKALAGANTQNMMVFVDDVDAHCERARKEGATIVVELKNSDYGEEYWEDRSYQARDLEGHHWWFCQRLREPTGPVPKYAKE